MATNIPMDADALAAAQQGYMSVDKILTHMVASTKTLKASQDQINIAHTALKNLVAEEFSSEQASLSLMKEMGILEGKQLKMAQDALNLSIKETTNLKAQRAEIDATAAAFERTLKGRQQDVELLRSQGKLIRANTQEYLNQFKVQGQGATHIGRAVGTVGAEVATRAQDPASMLSALGPWGVILKMIVDIIDGLRAMTSTMSQANAASGNFIKGFKSAGDEAAQIMSQQTEMMYNYGLTTEEVGEIYKGLKDTGLQALGTIPKTGSAMSGVADSVFAFAKATGQTYDQVSTQFAELTRTNGVATSEIRKSYMEVFNVAEKAGQAGVASATQVMQSIFAMDQQFASVGANVKGISDIVSGLTDILSSSKIAGGIEQLNKVSQGIIGISSASDGMLVMLGKMGGMSGTFSQVWEKMKGINPTTGYIEKGAQPIQQNLMMFGSLMDKISTMAGGGSQGRYTADTFAQKNFGMDINTTQAARDLYAKMKNAAPGSMDQKQAQKKFEDMLATAKKTQLDSKGMFEILKNILVGLIAKPIIAIWGIATKFGGDKAAQQRYATGVDNIIKKKTDNGMNFLLDDQISKAATARKKAGVHFGANGQVVVHNNVTANGQLSPAQIAAAGKAAQQGTVQLLQKQQKANTGSH